MVMPSETRWSRLTPPQQFMAVLIPLGVLLAFLLSLADNVPDLAKRTAIRAGFYDDVQGGILGVHPWTWLHYFGWLALAAATATALARNRLIVLSALGLFGLSVLIEVMQSNLTNERGFSTDDVVANGFGIATGAFFGMAITQYWARHHGATGVPSPTATIND